MIMKIVPFNNQLRTTLKLFKNNLKICMKILKERNYGEFKDVYLSIIN